MRGTRETVGASGAMMLVALLGCGSDEPNLPPTAEIDPGLVSGDTVSYSVRIAWTGSDPDGNVVRFEYTVDPPPEFSEREIALGGPGITVYFLPRDDSSPARTRMRKIVDGRPVEFDWIHTEDAFHDFLFSATEGDSAGQDTLPTGRFFGMHAVYLRAVDDDGAYSEPDKVALTSRTIAPSSRQTIPAAATEPILVGTSPIIRWTGEDPDGPVPLTYLVAMIPIPPGLYPDILEREPWTFVEAQPVSWERVTQEPSEEETPGAIGKQFSSLVPGLHFFAVRAVDEAGAIEPFLDWGRNATVLAVSANLHPVLSIGSTYGPPFVFPGDGVENAVEVILGTEIRFYWSASAEHYAEGITGYSWGVDIIDLDDEHAWTAWSPSTGAEPFAFPTVGMHTLSVRARDTSGNVTRRSLWFDVIRPSFEREALWVDDSFDNTYPNDLEHDTFWRSMFQHYAANSDWDVSTFSEIHVHGAGDREILEPPPVVLSELGRYKMVIWENHGGGYNGISSLLKTATLSPRLRAYLGAGGKLWLGGRYTVAATTRSANNVNANLTYPKEELGPGDFAYDFLKLRSARLNNDKGAGPGNTLVGVAPFPGEPEIYPAMSVEFDKLNIAQIGVPFCDAIFEPILEGPGFRGDIDSLYVYQAAAGGSSAYEGQLTAIRWHDPDPGREHGRTQWFGFPMYYFQDDQAKETFRRSVDWFREENPAGPDTP